MLLALINLLMVLENKRNQVREQRSIVARLKALFDWIDDIMPSLYTMSADRVRLAKQAFSKLEK